MSKKSRTIERIIVRLIDHCGEWRRGDIVHVAEETGRAWIRQKRAVELDDNGVPLAPAQEPAKRSKLIGAGSLQQLQHLTPQEEAQVRASVDTLVTEAFQRAINNLFTQRNLSK